MASSQLSDATSNEQTVFLVDGSALGRQAEPDWMAAHHLDSPERLAACCQQVRSLHPAACIRVFVSTEGFLQLREKLGTEFHPTWVQCVPPGCRVVDFLLEFGRKRAMRAMRDVVAVSNAAEVRTAGRIRHLGFMFVDGELLMPGLTVPEPDASDRGAEREPQRSRSRSRSRRSRGEDSHTLRDSQLDGESLEECGALGDTQIDEAEARPSGDRGRKKIGTCEDLSFAETQVVEDFEPAPAGTQPEGLSGQGSQASVDSKASRVSWGGEDSDEEAKHTEESISQRGEVPTG